MRIVRNGDVHVFAPIGLSRRKVLQFINEHRQWIADAREQTRQKVEARKAFFAQLPLSSRKHTDEARARLSAIVEPLVAKHAAEMGVSPEAITYRKMVSRWGMCNVRTRTICFSLYLLLLPDWCQEHIVVHELCHLLEPSHNARFHSLMDHYYPQWRAARQATKSIA